MSKMRETAIRIVLLAMLLAATLSGCKSSKKAVATTVSEEKKSCKELVETLVEGAFRYETLTARLNLSLELSGKEVSSRVDMKLVRDSALQLSVQPFLGVEMFRIELSTDSVKIIDRLNKRYLVEGYTHFLDQLQGPNYSTFQSLFTNHLFLLGKTSVNSSDHHRFKLTRTGSQAELAAKGPHETQTIFGVEGETTLRSAQITHEATSYALTWHYDDFQPVGEQVFPMFMQADVTKGKENLGGMTLRYARIRVNEPIRWDSSIPTKYTRVTMDEILRMIKLLN